LASVCWAAPAAAAPLDAASAHTALRAHRAYASSTLSKVGAAGRSDDAFIATIAAKCPGVLTSLNTAPPSSYNQSTLVEFGKEVGADTVVAAFVPYRSVLATLERRAARLHWSSAATGRRIRKSLAAQRTVFELSPSDLCTDASALAADAKTTPPGTTAFTSTFESEASVAGLTAFKRTLHRYRPAGDSKLERLVNRLATRADTKLERLVNAKATKLLGVLGLKI
jgi:hypothetical protein